MEKILNTADVCQILHINRLKVQQYREAGLLRMFKKGKGYVTTEAELDRFLKMCVDNQLDLTSPERIILAGMQMKKAAGLAHHTALNG